MIKDVISRFWMGINLKWRLKEVQVETLKGMYERLGRKLSRVLHSEKGQGIVEYILVILLISIVLVIALSSTGMSQAVNNAGSKIASAMGTP
jgi:Flp pilus assembly pilin Flp